MADEQKPLEVSPEAPQPKAQNASMTEAEFIARLEDLIASARAAGLRHVPFIVGKYAARNVADVFGNFLDELDQNYSDRRQGRRSRGSQERGDER